MMSALLHPYTCRLAALALAAVAAACAAPVETLPPAVVGTSSTKSAGAAPLSVATDSWRPGIAPVPARPSREPAFVVNLDPAALLGMARADVAALLGPPNILRRDPPAEMWQYQNEACVVHVFLFVAKAEAGYRVRHVEVRDRRSDAAPAGCYDGLISAPTRDAG